MEIKAQGRRRGSKNYTNEFRTQVVAETRDPTRSLAEVARAHGLNANLVSKWRRDQEQEATSASAPVELFPPVQMASPPIPEPVRSSGWSSNVMACACVSKASRSLMSCGLC